MRLVLSILRPQKTAAILARFGLRYTLMNHYDTQFTKKTRLPGLTRYLDKSTSKQGGQGAPTNIIYEQNT